MRERAWEGERPREPKSPGSSEAIRARGDARPPNSFPRNLASPFLKELVNTN
jgi:hypothetical protein